MPHFVFESNDDGSIARILKDGQPIEGQVRLEQLYSVVTIYFRLAAEHVARMTELDNRDQRRAAGLQSFLMSLTGLEAFTNTYFHLRAQELGSEQMLLRIRQTHGSLSRKIGELIGMTPESQLVGQADVLDKIFELSQLRNEIVHPRWTPAALTITGRIPVNIMGLVENPQAVFEDAALCREALFRCLLVVARVGQARGHAEVSGFLFHWTGNYGLTLDAILNQLGQT